MNQIEIFIKPNDDTAHFANRVFSYLWKIKKDINFKEELKCIYDYFNTHIKNFYELEQEIPAIYYYFLTYETGVDLNDRDVWSDNFSSLEDLKIYVYNYCNDFYLKNIYDKCD